MKTQVCLITGCVPREAGFEKEMRVLEPLGTFLGSVHWKGRNQLWAEGEGELQYRLSETSVVL